MNILAITSDEFFTQAKGWLMVATELLIPLTAFIGGLFGVYAALVANLNKQRLDSHSAKISNLQIASVPQTPTTVTQINEPAVGRGVTETQSESRQ